MALCRTQDKPTNRHAGRKKQSSLFGEEEEQKTHKKRPPVGRAPSRRAHGRARRAAVCCSTRATYDRTRTWRRPRFTRLPCHDDTRHVTKRRAQPRPHRKFVPSRHVERVSALLVVRDHVARGHRAVEARRGRRRRDAAQRRLARRFGRGGVGLAAATPPRWRWSTAATARAFR